MKTYTLPKYGSSGPWPLLTPGSAPSMEIFNARKNSACGNNYGDAECPFCDFVFRREGETFSIGDKCKKCDAIVTGSG